jgi:hypothetical protein
MKTGKGFSMMGTVFVIIAGVGVAIAVAEIGRNKVPQRLGNWISTKCKEWKKNGVLERAKRCGTETEHQPD